MQGAATQAMPLRIVEERQRRRCPHAAAPLRAVVRRPAGSVARSLHTRGYAASLAPCRRAWGPQQSVNVISSQTLRVRPRPSPWDGILQFVSFRSHCERLWRGFIVTFIILAAGAMSALVGLFLSIIIGVFQPVSSHLYNSLVIGLGIVGILYGVGLVSEGFRLRE